VPGQPKWGRNTKRSRMSKVWKGNRFAARKSKTRPSTWRVRQKTDPGQGEGRVPKDRLQAIKKEHLNWRRMAESKKTDLKRRVKKESRSVARRGG